MHVTLNAGHIATDIAQKTCQCLQAWPGDFRPLTRGIQERCITACTSRHRIGSCAAPATKPARHTANMHRAAEFRGRRRRQSGRAARRGGTTHRPAARGTEGNTVAKAAGVLGGRTRSQTAGNDRRVAVHSRRLQQGSTQSAFGTSSPALKCLAVCPDRPANLCNVAGAISRSMSS